MCRLGGVKFGGAESKVLTGALSDNTTLTSLEYVIVFILLFDCCSFGKCEFGDEGAKALAALLRNNRTLTTVRLV